VMLIELAALMIGDLLRAIVCSLEEIWCHGGVRSNQLYPVQLPKQSTKLCL